MGSDVWALAWMRTWWSFEQGDSSDTSFQLLQEAFYSVRDSNSWVISTENESVAYLHPGAHKSKIFPFSDEIATSFYPMIRKQFDAEAEDKGPSLHAVYRYFENTYSRWFDSNNDGVADSFQYNTALKEGGSTHCTQQSEAHDCKTGDYSIWATANLVLGMALPYREQDYLRRLFRRESKPSPEQTKVLWIRD